jgi:hypothetical protein
MTFNTFTTHFSWTVFFLVKCISWIYQTYLLNSTVYTLWSNIDSIPQNPGPILPLLHSCIIDNRNPQLGRCARRFLDRQNWRQTITIIIASWNERQSWYCFWPNLVWPNFVVPSFFTTHDGEVGHGMAETRRPVEDGGGLGVSRLQRRNYWCLFLLCGSLIFWCLRSLLSIMVTREL